MGEGEAEAKNGLENISKSLATALAAIYFLGFLVVTRHLSQYCVSPLAILKLQYLIAGVWLLAPLAWPFLLIVAIGVMNLFPRDKQKTSSPLQILRELFSWSGLFQLVIFVLPFTIVVVVLARLWFGSINEAFNFFTRVFVEQKNSETWLSFFIGIVGLAAGTVYTLRFAEKQTDEGKKWNYRILASYIGGLGVLILLWYVSYFAKTWYPFIPYYLGGGKPISVVFLLKTEEGHKELPVVPDSSGERSIPYKMLFETEKTFVVLSPKTEEQAIEFERDAVSGVVFLREAAAVSSPIQSSFDGSWIIDTNTIQFPQKPTEYLLSNGTFRCLNCAANVEIKADGHDHKVSETGYSDTMSVRALDAHTVEIISKKAGKTTFAEVNTISPDESTLTQIVKDTTGVQPVTIETISKRVANGPAGSHALSGSWRTYKANRSKNGATISYTLSTDGFSARTPTGERFDAKFDGRDYPVEGDPGHTVVSVKRLTPNAVEQTSKRDGKVVGVLRLIVVPDGQTIHVAYENKEANTTTSYDMRKVPQ